MKSVQLTQEKEQRFLRINENGQTCILDHQGLLDFHKGDSLWGCAVGFRAMQAAEQLFSENATPWDRFHLYIVSAHPGPGVKDAIEFVTHCISKNRFRLTEHAETSEGCDRDMKFEWWISDGRATANIKLRENFVPEKFFTILDRIKDPSHTQQDKKEFDQCKSELSDLLWQTTLMSAFTSEFLPSPLSIGALPDA